MLTVRLSSPLTSHPASRLLSAIEKARGRITEAKMVSGNDKVYHTFVIESLGSDIMSREKLMEAFSR